MRIARRLQHPNDDNARLICGIFVHDRKLPSGVVTGLTKRRVCWVCQAACLLDLPSGVVTEPVKRRKCWVRQAAQLLGKLSWESIFVMYEDLGQYHPSACAAKPVDHSHHLSMTELPIAWPLWRTACHFPFCSTATKVRKAMSSFSFCFSNSSLWAMISCSFSFSAAIVSAP